MTNVRITYFSSINRKVGKYKATGFRSSQCLDPHFIEKATARDQPTAARVAYFLPRREATVQGFKRVGVDCTLS